MNAPPPPSPSTHRRAIRMRRSAFRLLNDRPRTFLSKFTHVALVTLIIANVLAVIAESVEEWGVVHGPIFHAFDQISVGVFSIEYLARLWACVDLPGGRYRHPVWGRLRWAFTPMAMIDLIAVLPFYLGIVVDIDLRVLRVLRIMRIFKLSRYSLALTVIVDVVRQESRAIGAMLIVLSVVIVVSASLVYLAEHHAQPHVFKDIPSAMWWAVVTVTTLGYGDMVPITVPGKILGAITAVCGLGMIALPAGVLASGFSEQLRMRREEFRGMVDDALDEDGHIDRRERRILDEARRQLRLTEEEAIEILESEVRGVRICPHCGKPHRLADSADI